MSGAGVQTVLQSSVPQLFRQIGLSCLATLMQQVQ